MFKRFVPIVFLALGLYGCGSGTSSGQTSGIIDRSGKSIGRITAFGSVIVNGIAYDTTSASIRVDDQPAQESDLSVGQIVVIIGLVNPDGTSGTADSIEVDPTIVGEITALDPIQNTFQVLQTTIQITSSTLFASTIQPADISALNIGDAVEIYGNSDSNNQIRATLIQPANATELEIRGRVSQLDSNGRTFSIGATSIDYTNANLEDFDDAIADGDVVEVEGSTVLNDTLIAERVEFEGEAGFSAQDQDTEVEIEGLITRFVNAADFDVNGIAVSTTGTTAYSGGTAQNLELDVALEVEGNIDANGILIAEEIEFELEDDIVAEGRVDSVDLVNGSVTLLAIEFTSNANTSLVDESDARLQFFALSDVAVNDYLKIKASSGESTTQATLIKRLNPEDNSKLKGPVSSVNDPSLTVLTADITTDSSTTYEIAETPATSIEFFNAIQIGDTIEVEGQPTINGLAADSLELE